MQEVTKFKENFFRRWSKAITTFGTVTDKISDLTLKEENAVSLVYRFRNRVSHRAAAFVHGCLSGRYRYRNLGKQPAGRLGVRHYQLRLVDRHRSRRNADFRDSAAAQSKMAHVDQPFRRSDDAFCRRLRRMFPLLHTGRPWLAYWLFPVSEHDGDVASISQPFDVGRFRGFDLRDGFGFVLVCRFDSRFATLRDRAKNQVFQNCLRALAMGWRGSARHWHRYEIAYLLAWPGFRRRSCFRFTRSLVSTSRCRSFPGWHATIFPPYFVAGAFLPDSRWF
jgi:hypothetical protein